LKRYHCFTQTTLDIDDDVLQVAKQIAILNRKTLGQVVSELLRQALDPKPAPKSRNGVPLFDPNPGTKTPGLALVNKLRDQA